MIAFTERAYALVDAARVLNQIGQRVLTRYTSGITETERRGFQSIEALEGYLRSPRLGAVRTIYSNESVDPASGEVVIKSFTLTVGDVGHKARARLLLEILEQSLSRGRQENTQRLLDSLLEVKDE